MNDITPQELKQRLQHGEEIHILDVREEWEYDETNIGAKLLPLTAIPFHLSELEALRTSELIVHCKSGTRSNQAKKYLTKQGFTQVRSLTGGIEAYLKQQ